MFFKKWFKKKAAEKTPDPDTPPKKEPTSLMTREQIDQAHNWLEDKWPKSKRGCKVCGKKQYIMAKDLVTPNRFIKEHVVYGGDAYPCFMLVCQNCADTRFFNAVASGLHDPDKSVK